MTKGNMTLKMQNINYLGLDFPHEPLRHIVLDVDVQGLWVDGRLAGWALHGEEGVDGLDLCIVARVSHGFALGSHEAGSHPSRVLSLLKTNKYQLVKKDFISTVEISAR